MADCNACNGCISVYTPGVLQLQLQKEGQKELVTVKKTNTAKYLMRVHFMISFFFINKFPLIF